MEDGNGVTRRKAQFGFDTFFSKMANKIRSALILLDISLKEQSLIMRLHFAYSQSLQSCQFIYVFHAYTF